MDVIVGAAAVEEVGTPVDDGLIAVVVGGFTVAVVVVGGFDVVGGAFVVGGANVQTLKVSLPTLMHSWPLYVPPETRPRHFLPVQEGLYGTQVLTPHRSPHHPWTSCARSALSASSSPQVSRIDPRLLLEQDDEGQRALVHFPAVTKVGAGVAACSSNPCSSTSSSSSSLPVDAQLWE